MKLELSDRSFVPSVSPFYLLATGESASGNAGQSIYKYITSCRILYEIAVKSIPVNDSSLNFSTVSSNPSCGEIPNKTPHDCRDCTPYDITDNCIEHSVIKYIGWPIGIGIGWVIVSFIITVIEGNLPMWFYDIYDFICRRKKKPNPVLDIKDDA